MNVKQNERPTTGMWTIFAIYAFRVTNPSSASYFSLQLALLGKRSLAMAGVKSVHLWESHIMLDFLPGILNHYLNIFHVMDSRVI